MKSLKVDRRTFVQSGAAGFAFFAAGGLNAQANFTGASVSAAEGSELLAAIARLNELGPLLPPDENGVRLPAGFRSRIVARSGEAPSNNSRVVWHPAPDGGAVFASADGGWVYASNSELRNAQGGVRALRFDSSGTVVDCYSILENTTSNCAGGATPWGTWLSCEEHEQGLVFECDPQQAGNGAARPLLGRFEHEAVAVDLINDQLYLTEDQRDGGFYRFTATRGLPDLSAGQLEIASVVQRGESYIVEWLPVPDPLASTTATRYQVAGSQAFRGGEGIAFHNGIIYFTTKRDNRVWSYRIASSELSIIYDIDTSDDPLLAGVDNVTVTPRGDVLVAEDGGDMQLVVLAPSQDGEQFDVIPLLQVVGHEASEITGPAFDPSYTRLYFSSQRGAEGSNEFGVTFEISKA